MHLQDIEQTLAITMWDFSWLERRWSGAGYEDWDRALDALAERGYNAVRIDAYPHFSGDFQTPRTLLPAWDQNDWGSPGRLSVTVQPQLNTFLGKCRDRGIHVGLSSWYREDLAKTRKAIPTSQAQARIWTQTLDSIADGGMLDALIYVDLCNEWPDPTWAPYYHSGGSADADWAHPDSLKWMRESIAIVREAYPDMDYCYSFASHLFDRQDEDLSFMDFLEPHTWMARDSDFYARIGYDYPKFERYGYDLIVEQANALYRSDTEHWQSILVDNIKSLASWSEKNNLPLITTECWGIVDYKDYPGLDWGWVKELSEIGVRAAVETGRWIGIATSNFCGPQFHGMWNDVAWHRRLTDIIKGA